MAEFYYMQLEESVLKRIGGITIPEDAQITADDLRSVHVTYRGFDGEDHEGEIIVNKYIVFDVMNVFRELYEQEYPIEQILPMESFDNDDLKAMAANNTSAFCYRKIWGTDELSNHALGFAIDLNPKYNPYISYHDGKEVIQPDNYVARDENNAHMIDHDDKAYKIFKRNGFEWGGDWENSKDYHHFQKVMK